MRELGLGAALGGGMGAPLGRQGTLAARRLACTAVTPGPSSGMLSNHRHIAALT